MSELDWLKHCRKLFLQRHEVLVQIGVHAFEKTAPQRIWFDVALFVSLEDSRAVNDQLSEVVDYDFIRQTIAQQVARGPIELQETLCDEVARELLDHPQVQAVRLSTCKPDVYPDCEAVGVEVFLVKSGSARQTLSLNGLRFDASLGVLAHEKNSPQPIQVDAELNLGPQPLKPHKDDIHHVLDYRKIRQLIINECTAQHVNLLESLIGKLADRLLQLPGVLGVRVKIVKLEIFDDCEVAIRAETGQW
jgi:dihydroneopterin aldolase